MHPCLPSTAHNPHTTRPTPLPPPPRQDDDPYVRKTAAVCVAKLFDINPELVEDRGFLDMLRVRGGAQGGGGAGGRRQWERGVEEQGGWGGWGGDRGEMRGKGVGGRGRG